MNIYDIIKKNDDIRSILSELPPEYLNQIQIRHYRSGEIMIPRSCTKRQLFIILDGICRTTVNFESGNIFSFYKFIKGDLFGFSDIYNTFQTLNAETKAKTSVTALIISAELFQECFGIYQRFSTEITTRIISRLQQDNRLLVECNNCPLNFGIVTYLIYSYKFYRRGYAPDYKGFVRINENRSDMGTILGVNERSINRGLQELKKNGLFEIVRGKVEINYAQYQLLEIMKTQLFD